MARRRRSAGTQEASEDEQLRASTVYCQACERVQRRPDGALVAALAFLEGPSADALPVLHVDAPARPKDPAAKVQKVTVTLHVLIKNLWKR